MPICPHCHTAYLDGETHVCVSAGKHLIVRISTAISGVAIYFVSLNASVAGANAYFHYHDEAAGGLAFMVIVNPTTLGALCWIFVWSLLSRRSGFTGFASVWVAAAAMGFLQVLFLIKFLGAA